MATEGIFWLIWNPSSFRAPTTKFASYSQAKAVARKLAETNKGERFYVLEASDFYETETIVHGRLR